MAGSRYLARAAAVVAAPGLCLAGHRRALGMGAWHLGWLAVSSLASHALAVGAMGGLILAMLARVSLGHTGRPLQPPPAMSWAFALLQLAVLSRVALAAFAVSGLWLAALCWCLAFGSVPAPLRGDVLDGAGRRASGLRGGKALPQAARPFRWLRLPVRRQPSRYGAFCGKVARILL